MIYNLHIKVCFLAVPDVTLEVLSLKKKDFLRLAGEHWSVRKISDGARKNERYLIEV